LTDRYIHNQQKWITQEAVYELFTTLGDTLTARDCARRQVLRVRESSLMSTLFSLGGKWREKWASLAVRVVGSSLTSDCLYSGNL